MTAPVIRSFAQRNLRFFLTAPQPCPYLPGQRERKAFTSLEVVDAPSIHDALAQSGFRRSQTIAYRPACDRCNACVSARVVAGAFAWGRRWRRVQTRNIDIKRSWRAPEATEEHFDLLKSYLNARHPEGGMAEMSGADFTAMVEETTVRTHIVDYRYASGPKRGALAAAALVDVLSDGLSLVYSFYDPEEERRSLGAFIILDHIAQAREAGFPYVYLGYWIRGSERMAYKAQFQPLELLRRGVWRPFDEVVKV